MTSKQLNEQPVFHLSRAGNPQSGRYSTPSIDSDDESVPESKWEWIYEDERIERSSTSKALDSVVYDYNDTTSPQQKHKPQPSIGAQKILGARSKDFEFRIGDGVLVNCGEPLPWVAIIRSFDITVFGDEKVDILWMSNHTDIVNKKRKRLDILQNEIYLTPLKDTIEIATISGIAKIISERTFSEQYPNGIPENLKENQSVFVCRRGCEARAATYTKNFDWDNFKLRTQEDIDHLHEWIKAETKLTKKSTSSRQKLKIDNKDLQSNTVAETPRKKQRFTSTSPSKLKTPSKLVTPSHKRVIIKKPLEFTPLGTRFLDPGYIESSPFQTARCRLHVASVPASLPCREDEFAQVYSHLEAAIIEGSGTCIYISGTPGTGKTATVLEVVAQLQAAVQADELDPFTFVEINGMKMTDPTQSYALLWEAIKGDRVSPTHALGLLEREFSNPSPRRTPCVVLMDELDQLVTRNQLVMYNFFNWPGLLHSRLIVLAVANTMDLPERTLSNKISSRLGLTRITFPGYSFDQLVQIISARLGGISDSIVEKDAIEFASRKVAAVSGDARRVLDICRRAVELAEADARTNLNSSPSKNSARLQGIGRVRIDTIRRAIKEATTSPLQNYLRGLPLTAKILLVALFLRTRRNGIREDTLGSVLDEAKKIAKLNTANQKVYELLFQTNPRAAIGMSPSKKASSSSARLLGMNTAAVDLMEAGIVGLETRRADRTGRIRLCIGDEDVRIAFKDDPEVKNLGF